jgi:hypothetical protein
VIFLLQFPVGGKSEVTSRPPVPLDLRRTLHADRSVTWRKLSRLPQAYRFHWSFRGGDSAIVTGVSTFVKGET